LGIYGIALPHGLDGYRHLSQHNLGLTEQQNPGVGGLVSSVPFILPCPGISTETGTIAGVASALAMALIGAVSSYISYQQKKFCFSIQRKYTSEQGKGLRQVLIPSPGYSTPVGFLAGTLLHP
jgi:hypothetical protein